VKEKLPGSYEYWLRTYQILGKKLKLRGRIISMLVDRNRALDLKIDKITRHFKIETCLAMGLRKGLLLCCENKDFLSPFKTEKGLKLLLTYA
jgi:hypothetical protein